MGSPALEVSANQITNDRPTTSDYYGVTTQVVRQRTLVQDAVGDPFSNVFLDVIEVFARMRDANQRHFLGHATDRRPRHHDGIVIIIFGRAEQAFPSFFALLVPLNIAD